MENHTNLRDLAVLEDILRKRNRELKRILDKKKRSNRIKNVLISILSLVILSLIYQLNNKIAIYNQNQELIDSNKKLEFMLDQITDSNIEMENMILKLSKINVSIDNQNKILIEEKNELINELDLLYKREELYDKYEYAIIDRANNRTDITYENLETLEKSCQTYNIDPDLILSIAMVESNGQADAANISSSARGLGQFLSSTGKYVYEDIMENGTDSYNHDMAFNSEVNLAMMVAYINYLRNHNNSLVNAIKSYCGDTSKNGNFVYSYINKLNSYLSRANKSIYEMN